MDNARRNWGEAGVICGGKTKSSKPKTGVVPQATLDKRAMRAAKALKQQKAVG